MKLPPTRWARNSSAIARPGGVQRRRAITVGAVAILSVAATLTGCRGGGTGAANLGQITVAATPGVADAPLYLAAREGLFSKAGLKVTIESSHSDAASLHALTTGSVNVAAADYPDFFYVQSNIDVSLKFVADGYDAAPNVMGVLALPGSRLNTPQSLVGKTVGTPEPEEFPYQASAPYNLETLATQSVLLNDGVQPTQVHWRPMPEQDLAGALKDHRVNAILVSEPYLYQAESQLGATEVIDSLSGSTANLPLSGYFAYGTFALTHAAALRTFRSVLLQAQAEAATGKGVRTVIAQAPKMNTLTAAMVTLGVYPATLNVSGVQQVANLMADYSMLAVPVDVSTITFH
ncbi:MAG TPA: ABC transporter substrate-binding protein [Streptosporangiaceae bacterium]|jgi:NitT/TauT family transport system substrate-binding protein